MPFIGISDLVCLQVVKFPLALPFTIGGILITFDGDYDSKGFSILGRLIGELSLVMLGICGGLLWRSCVVVGNPNE